MSAELWEQRFRAPVSFLPEWSPGAPSRAVYASNESGRWQLHTLDADTGATRQASDDPVGIVDGLPTLDGEGVLWFEDESGDEAGAWVVQPFHGGAKRPSSTASHMAGRTASPRRRGSSSPGSATVTASRSMSRWAASRRASCTGRANTSDWAAPAGGGFVRGALSADGTLLCLEHAEHGDLIHPALRVVDPRSGATVGERRDEGMHLASSCWSPVAGDLRLAFTHERDGDERPGIWDLASGARHDLELDLGGAVTAADWWPDASALLLLNILEGRSYVYRYDVASGALEQIATEPGFVWRARVRPDGRIWLLHEQGRRRRLVLDDSRAEVVTLDGSAPEGRPYESWHFENEHGQGVHGFFVTPDDSGGPFPVLMFVHGGPTWFDLDRWQPEVQAYVDLGFVVGLVNYRGSTGYGREWRDTLIGNIGGPELEDVNAGLRDLVVRGLADPDRAVIAGYSWGGYVTLLELGKHPGLWQCGVAGVPVGDYEAGYEELSPVLQAYDRALLGGKTPAELPELMRERNAINFADAVRAPVLFFIGRNDSRCPYGQAMAYVDKLAAREHPHEVVVYETGHSSFDVDEKVEHVGIAREFLRRHVPGLK